MRNIALKLSILFIICFLPVSLALGDWDPGDGYKMHFPQMPDLNGWDVAATWNVQLPPVGIADDWLCTETGWVKDIHFWGSWMHGNFDAIRSFVIEIYSDIPGPPFSRPGQLLWVQQIQEFTIRPYPSPPTEGWYNPATGQIYPGDHAEYFQYNVFLPESLWFHQTAGTIYWLSIYAMVVNPSTVWGWKTSLNHWNDFALWSIQYSNWEPLFDPIMQTPLDMAFVITGDTIPPHICPPYLPGDINGDHIRGGGDVTYGVRFFKLIGNRPPDSCYMDSTHSYLYVAGDVNGNCEFRASDITRLVAYFKLIAPLQYCHFFPPPPLREETQPRIINQKD
jgi:hypothetical protein